MRASRGALRRVAVVGLGSGTLSCYRRGDEQWTFFEIDPPHIAAATMVSLARCGALSNAKAAKAIRELEIDPDKIDPLAL